MVRGVAETAVPYFPVPFAEVVATETVYSEPFTSPVTVFEHTLAEHDDVLAVTVDVVAPRTYFTEYSTIAIPVALATVGHWTVTVVELWSLTLRPVGAGRRPAITVTRFDSDPLAASAFDCELLSCDATTEKSYSVPSLRPESVSDLVVDDELNDAATKELLPRE